MIISGRVFHAGMAFPTLCLIFITVLGVCWAQNNGGYQNNGNPYPQNGNNNNVPCLNCQGQNQQQQQQQPWSQHQQGQSQVLPGGNDQISLRETSGSFNYNPPGSSFGGNQPSSSARVIGTPLRFCTTTAVEHQDCLKMIFDLDRANVRSGGFEQQQQQMPNRGKRQAGRPQMRFAYQCIRAVDKLECMKWIGMDKTMARADIVLATPGEAYIGGRDYNLIPVSYEGLGPDKSTAEDQIVAVVRADRGITSVSQLRGKSACFGPVGDAVWDHVLGFLRTNQQIQAPRCEENSMDAVLRYFGDMCAPYDTRNFTDIENDRYRKMCSLCGGQNCPNLQTIGPDLSLNCLVQNPRVDVSFMRASVLSQAISSRTIPDQNAYQVLCPQSNSGSVPLVNSQTGPLVSGQNILEWPECYIGRTPTHAYLMRKDTDYVVQIGDKLEEIYTTGTIGGQTNQWLRRFFTGQYGGNQQVTKIYQYYSQQDATIDSYLDGYKPYLEDTLSCSTQVNARWCTTSKADQERCEIAKKAFKAYRLRPDLLCEPPVKNSYVCLDKINRNQSELAMIDIGDLVVAGTYFNAIQLAQERFVSQDQFAASSLSIIDEPYSIAVVKDAGINQLANLRGKRACFSGLWEAHGFMLPMDALKQAGQVDQGACRQLELAQGFFGDSCLPGLADGELNTRNEAKDKLCKQCDGGERGCSRNGDMKYSGQLGALRCLREGKGDVAFVSHTVLAEIPLEERQSYHLVCNTGVGTQSLEQYTSCNLGRAPGSVLVTNRYKGMPEKRRLVEMIQSASRLFSADPSSQSNQGFNPGNSRSALSSFTDARVERSRKTYAMFGKRNRTDTSPFGTNFPSGQTQGGFGQNPTVQMGVSNWGDNGEYAMFGMSTYDLRGFGDINTTHIGEALQTFRYIGERSNWRYCYDTGVGSRLSTTGVVSLLLIGMMSRFVFWH